MKLLRECYPTRPRDELLALFPGSQWGQLRAKTNKLGLPNRKESRRRGPM